MDVIVGRHYGIRPRGTVDSDPLVEFESADPEVSALQEGKGPDDRRQATVLFADLSGFTVTSQQVDPEDLKDAINDCFSVIERVVVEHGGTIDKYIGDCVMALFGAPVALENAPQHAINAAIAIRTAIDGFDARRRLPAPLKIHIGINTGLVAAGQVGGQDRRDYTVMGEAVNLASRLQSAAKDGQILVGEGTHRATAREFEFRRMKLTLKGYEKLISVFEVLSTEPQRYRARPRDASNSVPAMVGRNAEMNRILAVLEELQAGRGGVVAVVGENGMGKSRLLAEVLAAPVAKRVAVAEGRCVAVGSGLVFHPFVDFLRTFSGVDDDVSSSVAYEAFSRRLATLGIADSEDVMGAAVRLLGVQDVGEKHDRFTGLEGEALERVIRDAIVQLLRALAGERPLLFVIEDLHWADRASVRLLETLLPLAITSPICFLLLGRPYYPETTDRILDFLGRKLAERHIVERLTPLTIAAMTELVSQLVGKGRLAPELMALVADRTEGNPFYVEEVVRDLIERDGKDSPGSPTTELPVTIEGVIRARVDRADEFARRVLQVASVVGRNFDRDVVAELVGDDVDVDRALESLVAMDLLTGGLSRRTASARIVRFTTIREFVFKHALIQEAVYGSISRKTCRELHAACAAVIEKRFESHIQDAYGMLAYHCLRAEDFEKAEEYTFKAGEMAARAAASHEALRYFREAYRAYQATHGENGDKAKLALLECHIAGALFHTGNLSQSIEHFDAALSLYGEWLPGSTFTRWAKFVLDMGGLLTRLYSGKHRAGREVTPQAQRIGQILYDRALAENPTDPVRYVFDTIAASRYVQKLNLYECPYACEITATTGAFFTFGGISISIARRFLDEASHLVGETNSADEFSYLAMGTVVEYHAGDWSNRYDIDDDLMEKGLRAGRLWAADTYLGMAAERTSRQGQFGKARILIERLRELKTVYGYEFSASAEAAQTAVCLLEEGALDEAMCAMRIYYESRREDGLHVLALSGMAKIHALRAELDAAAESLSQADRIMADTRRLAPYYMGAYRTAQLMVAVKRLEVEGTRSARSGVAKLARKAIATARFIARERPEVWRYTARHLSLIGKDEKSLEACGRALDEATRLGAVPEVARSCAEIVRTMERWGGVAAYRDRTPLEWRNRGAEAFLSIGLEKDAAALGAVVGVREPKRVPENRVIDVSGK